MKPQTSIKLKEADRRKDEFLAMLSHELRNPLAPIANVVQILKTLDGRRTEAGLVKIGETDDNPN